MWHIIFLCESYKVNIPYLRMRSPLSVQAN